MTEIVATIPPDINALGYPIVPLQFELAGAMGRPCGDIKLFSRTITVDVEKKYVPIVRRTLAERGLILKDSEHM